jgi:Kef-type K+ transport system membrane component KefB
MNTRGLVELIALNIGYDLGILSPRIFSMLVLMALFTTFMTGPP